MTRNILYLQYTSVAQQCVDLMIFNASNQRLTELEDSLRKTEDLNSTLQDQVNRTKLNDPELQDKLQRAENEAKQLRQTLIDTEKKTEVLMIFSFLKTFMSFK